MCICTERLRQTKTAWYQCITSPMLPVIAAFPSLCLCLQGALLMSLLKKPLYLSSLTVLLNLPSSAVLLQQTAPQQTQQPALQQDASHSDISTDRLASVQTAVQRAVAGACICCLLWCSGAQCQLLSGAELSLNSLLTFIDLHAAPTESLGIVTRLCLVW